MHRARAIFVERGADIGGFRLHSIRDSPLYVIPIYHARCYRYQLVHCDFLTP